MSAVADAYPRLQALGVDVIAMSVDSQFVHKIWCEEELTKMVPAIPFPLASDAGGHIGRMYGVYDEASGVNIRGRFIIDPDGIVQAMEVMTPPVGRALGETIRQVQAFQHVRASKGTEACPAGWRPGKPTLEPGPALVGRVWQVWKPGEE